MRRWLLKLKLAYYVVVAGIMATSTVIGVFFPAMPWQKRLQLSVLIGLLLAYPLNIAVTRMAKKTYKLDQNGSAGTRVSGPTH